MYYILNILIYQLDILYLKDISDTSFRYHQLTRLTQGAILWVCGDRKWTFSTTTVTHILKIQCPLEYSYFKSYHHLLLAKMDIISSISYAGIMVVGRTLRKLISWQISDICRGEVQQGRSAEWSLPPVGRTHRDSSEWILTGSPAKWKIESES